MNLALPAGIMLSMIACSAGAFTGNNYYQTDAINNRLSVEAASKTPQLAPWQRDTVYQKGAKVEFAGQEYSARWWTENEQPGPSWVSWEPQTPDLALWSEARVYHQGELALFDGVIYQATYWTQGDLPNELASWQVAEVSTLLRKQVFDFRHEMEPNYILNGHNAIITTSTSINLRLDINDTFVFDHLRQYQHNGYWKTKLKAKVNGQECEGQSECNELLTGINDLVSMQPVYYAESYALLHSYGVRNVASVGAGEKHAIEADSSLSLASAMFSPEPTLALSVPPTEYPLVPPTEPPSVPPTESPSVPPTPTPMPPVVLPTVPPTPIPEFIEASAPTACYPMASMATPTLVPSQDVGEAVPVEGCIMVCNKDNICRSLVLPDWAIR